MGYFLLLVKIFENLYEILEKQNLLKERGCSKESHEKMLVFENQWRAVVKNQGKEAL